MIRGTIAAVALTAMLLLVGCGAQPGTTIVKYNHGDGIARMGEAPSDGTYRLYTSADANPIYTATLKKGDKLGFDKGDDGKTYAVAGNHREVVETSTLNRNVYWNRMKD